MNSSVWGLVGLVFLLLTSTFFSAARTALTGVRRQTLREQAEDGNRRAALALAVAEDSSRVLSTFRLAKLLADFLLAALVALVLIPPVAAWLTATTRLAAPLAFLVSYLVLVPVAAFLVFALTESLSETVVQRNPVGWVLRLVGPARLTLTLLGPFVTLARLVRRIVPTPPGGDAESALLVTEEEIMTLVDAGEEDGSIELEEKEMIYSIFQLDETLAREIMVPRIDVVAVEISVPLEQALEVIIRAGHSRIPVYQDSLDHIKGMLYAKDLLEVWSQNRESGELSALLRPALFIPETKRVGDLLRELQSAKVHMAVVIDEYGGTAGIVTIEDIVEEIVGEIFDEYDEAVDATYEMIAEDEYIFDGRIDLDDFNRLLDTNLPTELGDTLGGYIYGQLGKVPYQGEVIEAERLHIEVLSVVDRRIRKILVRRILPEEAPTSPPESQANQHANHNSR